MRTVGSIIAERTLILEQPTRKKRVTVRLGRPRPFRDGQGDYFCPFQIVGLGEDQVERAGGVDAFQAIQMAMTGIAVRLRQRISKNQKRSLYWLVHGDDLGFPEILTDPRIWFSRRPQ